MDRIAYKLAAERKAREQKRINYNALQIPKGKTVRQVRARKDRDDAERLKAFRDAVWERQVGLSINLTEGDVVEWQMARCQHCGAYVQRGRQVTLTGEVHHRISRRHKATRYDPANGVLLCNHLVNNCHDKAERGLIQV